MLGQIADIAPCSQMSRQVAGCRSFHRILLFLNRDEGTELEKKRTCTACL